MAYEEIVMQEGDTPEGDMPSAPPTEGDEPPASEGAEEVGN